MKKLLAVLLVLCLFVGMMPMAFAEETVEETPAEDSNPLTEQNEEVKSTEDETQSDTVENPEATWNGQDYATLQEAVTAAGDGESTRTVFLNKTVQLSSELELNGVSIDGRGEYWITGNVKVTGGIVYIQNTGIRGSVVINSGTLNINQTTIMNGNAVGVTVNNTATFNMGDGCDISGDVQILVNEGGIVSLPDAYKPYSLDGKTYFSTDPSKFDNPEQPEQPEEPERPVTAAEALIGNIVYNTLEEALNAAKPGDTVELLVDSQIDSDVVPSGVELLIRNGVTLTVTGTLTIYGRVSNYGDIVGNVEGRYTMPITLHTNVSGASITVWDSNGRVVHFIDEAGTYWLFPGKYYVRAEASGYYSGEDTFVVADRGMSVYIELSALPDEYRVYIANTEHGTVSVDTRYAEEGEWVYITVNPDAGYRLSDLTVTRPSGNTVKVEHVRGNVFRFAMPGVRVTVDAEFVRTTMPFTDVSRGQWFYDAVSFVYWRDLMDGVTSTQFAPDATTTRAMVVQILYRMAGSPTVRGSSPFYDVSNGAWYADAVIWAEANDIVNGMTTTTFAPNTAVTREQLATMLYRYAQYRHYNTSAGANTNILSYYDANRISEYAFSALQWACGEGVMDGTGTGYLSPQGQATRAQLAAMLMRFCMEYRI